MVVLYVYCPFVQMIHSPRSVTFESVCFGSARKEAKDERRTGKRKLDTRKSLPAEN
jgi:hypothetical protein